MSAVAKLVQKRPKWNKERRSMKIDEVVLLKDENLPRNIWPMGRTLLWSEKKEKAHVRKKHKIYSKDK